MFILIQNHFERFKVWKVQKCISLRDKFAKSKALNSIAGFELKNKIIAMFCMQVGGFFTIQTGYIFVTYKSEYTYVYLWVINVQKRFM